MMIASLGLNNERGDGSGLCKVNYIFNLLCRVDGRVVPYAPYNCNLHAYCSKVLYTVRIHCGVHTDLLLHSPQRRLEMILPKQHKTGKD